MSTCETHLMSWWVLFLIRGMMTALGLVEIDACLQSSSTLVLPSAVPPCGCVLQPSSSHLLPVTSTVPLAAFRGMEIRSGT